MTVSYTANVASSAFKFGCFLKLLVKWRGSIYRLLWRDLLCFLIGYLGLSLLYRFILTAHQRHMFEKVSYYCDKHGQLIPISFVLGFYVSLVVGRWWEQYKNIPWIDTLAIWINANIRGNKQKDRLLRRTLIRYANLTMVQCFILISPRVKKRFPTIDHLVEAGLLLENEKTILSELRATIHKKFKHPTNFVPLVWAAGIVTKARAENKIKNDSVANILLTELTKLKDQLNMLLSYDWISVPLVYTQVVTLAVYTYFLSCLMGRQWLFDREGKLKHSQPTIVPTLDDSGEIDDDENYGVKWNELDLFLPLFTVLQFLFYMGWLKTAESLLNPFGDDDDDFELNWFVDRNLQVGYMIVDGMHEYPELLKDAWWDDVVPPELPHTVASEQYDERAMEGSTANVVVTSKGAEIVSPPSIAEGLSKAGDSKKSFKEHGCNTDETLGLIKAAIKEEDENIDNVNTIQWDLLGQEEKEERPRIQDIFGIDIKSAGKEDEDDVKWDLQPKAPLAKEDTVDVDDANNEDEEGLQMKPLLQKRDTEEKITKEDT